MYTCYDSQIIVKYNRLLRTDWRYRYLSKNHWLELDNCKRTTMRTGRTLEEKTVGVTITISDLSPLALYVPCGCNSNSLILYDTPKSFVKSVRLFVVSLLKRVLLCGNSFFRVSPGEGAKLFSKWLRFDRHCCHLQVGSECFCPIDSGCIWKYPDVDCIVHCALS